jgi:predicted transposase/invertase (TIGR01784 family)
MTDRRISLPKLLPPSEDGVFKTLLTHPDAKPVLRDLIASVLNIPITDVEVRNTELPISDANEKRERFDVNCRTSDGKQIDVEMQARAVKGDSVTTGHVNFKQRAIYYLCDLHASQEGRGLQGYGGMLQSRQITFCGFTVFPTRKDLITRFNFRTEDGFLLSDAVGIVFVELTKLRAAMAKPVSAMTAAEMWGCFFRYADKPKQRDLLREIIAAKEEIGMANELLMSISREERERAHARSRKMFLMDLQHDKAIEREEGFRVGQAEGFRAGRAEVAKNALSMRLPTEQIEKLTGLSRAEIERLRDGE